MKKLKLFLPGILAFALFAACALWRNFYLFKIYCQKNYDLGIYLEAMRESAKGVLNPWLNTRQIYQYSDHWEPVMTFMGWIGREFGFINAALVGEVTFFAISALALVWLSQRFRVPELWISILIATMFLNRDQFDAVYFPIHESAWAAAPLLWLSAFVWALLEDGKTRWKYAIIFASLILCLFSEQFGFAIFGLGLGLLLFSSQKKFGLTVLVMAIPLMWWLTVGRQLFMTPIFPYYQQRIFISFHDLKEKYPFNFASYKTLFLHLIGMAPAFWVLIQFKRAGGTFAIRRWLVIMGLFGPLLLGRFLAGNFGLQYSVALTSAWIITFFYFAPHPKGLIPKHAWLAVLYLAFFANNKLRKPFATEFLHDGLECAQGTPTTTGMDQRQERLDHVFRQLEQQSDDKRFRILASGNLIPNLLLAFPNAEVFQLGGFAIVSTETVDQALLEYIPYGDTHFVDHAQIDKAKQIISGLPGINILENSDSLFWAKGKIPIKSLLEFYIPQPADFIQRPNAVPPVSE